MNEEILKTLKLVQIRLQQVKIEATVENMDALLGCQQALKRCVALMEEAAKNEPAD